MLALMTLVLMCTALVNFSSQTNFVDPRHIRPTPTLIPTPSPAPIQVQTPILGYTSIGAYTGRTPIGDKDSCRHQAPQSGKITSISFYIQTPNAQVRYGIYSDNNGQPYQLLAQSNLVSTGNGNQWVTAPLSAQVTGGPILLANHNIYIDSILEL